MENYWLYYGLGVAWRLALSLLILWPGVKLWKDPERIRPTLKKISDRFDWISDEFADLAPTVGGGLARFMVILGGILVLYSATWAYRNARQRQPGSFMQDAGVIPYQMPGGMPQAPQADSPEGQPGMTPQGTAPPPNAAPQPGYGQPGDPLPQRGVPGGAGGYSGGF